MLGEVFVHGRAQVDHELLELLEQFRRVLSHHHVEACGQRAEEFVSEIADVRRGVQRDDSPIGVLAGAHDVAGLLKAVQQCGGGARRQGDALTEAGR